MKIKAGFILRNVADQWVVVPIGERVVEVNGILTLSESGAFLWKILEVDTSEAELVKRILIEYDIDEDTAKKDVQAFVEAVRAKGLMD